LNFASFETLHPNVIISSTETFFAKLVQVWRIFYVKKNAEKITPL
jgi:hypothetical protein